MSSLVSSLKLFNMCLHRPDVVSTRAILSRLQPLIKHHDIITLQNVGFESHKLLSGVFPGHKASPCSTNTGAMRFAVVLVNSRMESVFSRHHFSRTSAKAGRDMVCATLMVNQRRLVIAATQFDPYINGAPEAMGVRESQVHEAGQLLQDVSDVILCGNFEFSDHQVLQRNVPKHLQGFADVFAPKETSSRRWKESRTSSRGRRDDRVLVRGGIQILAQDNHQYMWNRDWKNYLEMQALSYTEQGGKAQRARSYQERANSVPEPFTTRSGLEIAFRLHQGAVTEPIRSRSLMSG